MEETIELEKHPLHSYSKIFHLGHRQLADLLKGPVVVEEKVDGCVVPGTPILKADLTYAPASSLVVGDKLLAFEDTLSNPRLTESTVTVNRPIKKAVYGIAMSDRYVEASADHPWLVHQHTNNNGKMWVQTQDLKPGMQILALPVWTRNSSYESGYLAGFFDGEGTCFRGGNGRQRTLAVYQRVGKTCSYVLELLKRMGFTFSVDVRRRKKHWAKVASMTLRNQSWTHILRFIGTVAPIRLAEGAKKIWDGAPLNGVPRSAVVEIRNLGTRTVQGLSTTSKTYIANGLFSHNSQFSFGRRGDEIHFRSRGAIIYPEMVPKLFKPAVEYILSIKDKLIGGWTYRGEALHAPRHNTLTYGRTPRHNVVLFDIETDSGQNFLSPAAKELAADELDLETVPAFHVGELTDVVTLKNVMEKESFLGGCKLEGVVVKNYAQFGEDKKVLMGKWVREEFKEIHQGAWKAANPSRSDVIEFMVNVYRSEPRWDKAIQHLRDAGILAGEPKDIGPLIKEFQKDLLEECAAEIKEKLYEYAAPKILRGASAGLAEYYKSKLTQNQFEPKGQIQ